MNLKENHQGLKMVSIGSRTAWKTSVQGRHSFISICYKNLPGEVGSTKLTFTVPIGFEKNSEVTEFHTHALGIKYL